MGPKRANRVRFPYGPGTLLDAASDLYIAAIRAGDEARIEAARAEVYGATAKWVAPTLRPRRWDDIPERRAHRIGDAR